MMRGVQVIPQHVIGFLEEEETDLPKNISTLSVSILNYENMGRYYLGIWD